MAISHTMGNYRAIDMLKMIFCFNLCKKHKKNVTIPETYMSEKKRRDTRDTDLTAMTDEEVVVVVDFEGFFADQNAANNTHSEGIDLDDMIREAVKPLGDVIHQIECHNEQIEDSEGA